MDFNIRFYDKRRCESIKRLLRVFFKDKKGATGAECGLMVAAIAAVIVAIVIAMGGKVQNAFSTVNAAMTAT